jgi:hypothetical protein
VIALGLRWWKIQEPLQQDEFGPLYAVAERQGLPPGTMPTNEYPLKPVGSWKEVSERSVLPFGIANPLPLYHWLLYAFVQVLPIAEWSLRLPSLLAGLGCVAGVYFLCRRLLGAEVGLVAALLVAVDPMQVTVSVLARPYALANFACLLSFWGLLGIFYSKGVAGRVVGALVYGVSVALIAYLNPVLLAVLAGHLGVVAYWWLGRQREEAALAELPPDEAAPLNTDEWAFNRAPKRSAGQLLYWLGGCALAVVLFLPELGYTRDVQKFSQDHYEYLFVLLQPSLRQILENNSTFLIALIAVMAATYALRQMGGDSSASQKEAEKAPDEAAVESAAVQTAASHVTTAPSPVTGAESDKAVPEPPPIPPPAENPDLVWLARCWLFLPQILIVILAFGFQMQVSSTRYITYVTLGGAILLAYWATRERVRDARLGVVCVVALAVFFWGFVDWSRGDGLTTEQFAKMIVNTLNEAEQQKKWQPTDLVLYRSGFLEADFLPDGIPPTNLAHVESVAAAPITTLYPSDSPRSFVLLSLSQRRSDEVWTKLGPHYDPSRYYTKELADKIGRHSRYWVCPGQWNRYQFLASFLPWLANEQQWDLTVFNAREKPDNSFRVASGTGPKDPIAGFDEARPDDFPPNYQTFLVRQVTQQEMDALAAVGSYGTLTAPAPNSHLTIPVGLTIQLPTPRFTKAPAGEQRRAKGREK